MRIRPASKPRETATAAEAKAHLKAMRKLHGDNYSIRKPQPGLTADEIIAGGRGEVDLYDDELDENEATE
jgi:hypothetical protein